MMRRYPDLLTQREILWLFRHEVYTADLDAGIIFGQDGQQLVAQILNEEGHQWIQLYYKGKRRSIAIHRLIWMVGANAIIPKGFEVHHYNEDVKENGYWNLFCLYYKDHDKLHEKNGSGKYKYRVNGNRGRVKGELIKHNVPF